MISKYSHKGLNWIDLESPSNEEISHIIELLGVPAYIVEKINNKKKEDILDINEDFIIASTGQDLFFVVHDNYILTIHTTPIQAFDAFGKEMELDIIVEDKSKIKNNKLLFAYLLRNLHLDKENKINLSQIEYKKLTEHIKRQSKRLKLFTFLSILFLVTTIIFICL